ncbi:MAG: dUTP diphosphatase [Candidatus Pacebacteria bacterium]|nr:dUTP diphosphatase [Candidatus Paceibacterota bacterium]MBP9818460.1 dUTP diphosphatase [Candidatus Paceibacterota bacterium]
MKLKIKKIHPNAKIPNYAHLGDAGFDLYIPESITLQPGDRKTIPLGIAMEIPDGYVGLMFDKSSLSHKQGLKTFGNVIDSGYRGEIHAGLINQSGQAQTLEAGQKIIQMLIMPVMTVDIEEAETLSESKRGDGAFGSSGKY